MTDVTDRSRAEKRAAHLREIQAARASQSPEDAMVTAAVLLAREVRAERLRAAHQEHRPRIRAYGLDKSQYPPPGATGIEYESVDAKGIDLDEQHQAVVEVLEGKCRWLTGKIAEQHADLDKMVEATQLGTLAAKWSRFAAIRRLVRRERG